MCFLFHLGNKENSEEIINNFRKFIDENKNEIIALKILYSQPERRKELTYNMVKDLRDALLNPPYNLSIDQVWNAYQHVEPKAVKLRTPKGMLTDIISLIRFELKIDTMLEPYSEIVNRSFRDWVFRRNAGPVQFTNEQMEWLRMIKDHVVSSVRIDKDDCVIFSCSVIPNQINIDAREHLEELLKHKHVRIFKDIHVSGHAAKEDLRDLINMVKPLNLIPAHCEARMKTAMKELADECSVPHVILMNDGERREIK